MFLSSYPCVAKKNIWDVRLALKKCSQLIDCQRPFREKRGLSCYVRKMAETEDNLWQRRLMKVFPQNCKDATSLWSPSAEEDCNSVLSLVSALTGFPRSHYALWLCTRLLLKFNILARWRYPPASTRKTTFPLSPSCFPWAEALLPLQMEWRKEKQI